MNSWDVSRHLWGISSHYEAIFSDVQTRSDPPDFYIGLILCDCFLGIQKLDACADGCWCMCIMRFKSDAGSFPSLTLSSVKLPDSYPCLKDEEGLTPGCRHSSIRYKVISTFGHFWNMYAYHQGRLDKWMWSGALTLVARSVNDEWSWMRGTRVSDCLSFYCYPNYVHIDEGIGHCENQVQISNKQNGTIAREIHWKIHRNFLL